MTFRAGSPGNFRRAHRCSFLAADRKRQAHLESAVSDAPAFLFCLSFGAHLFSVSFSAAHSSIGCFLCGFYAFQNSIFSIFLPPISGRQGQMHKLAGHYGYQGALKIKGGHRKKAARGGQRKECPPQSAHRKAPSARLRIQIPNQSLYRRREDDWQNHCSRLPGLPAASRTPPRPGQPRRRDRRRHNSRSTTPKRCRMRIFIRLPLPLALRAAHCECTDLKQNQLIGNLRYARLNAGVRMKHRRCIAFFGTAIICRHFGEKCTPAAPVKSRIAASSVITFPF